MNFLSMLQTTENYQNLLKTVIKIVIFLSGKNAKQIPVWKKLWWMS